MCGTSARRLPTTIAGRAFAWTVLFAVLGCAGTSSWVRQPQDPISGEADQQEIQQNELEDDSDTDIGAETDASEEPGKARFYSSPSERREELAAHELLPNLFAGAEAESRLIFEDEGPLRQWSSSFEGVTLAGRYQPLEEVVGALELAYDRRDGVKMDVAIVTLGGTEEWPWYLELGRTNAPFGEFNSRFREDPGTAILGEINDELISGGYDSDFFEVTLSIVDGDVGDDPYGWVGNFTCTPIEGLDLGAYWVNDITQADELEKILRQNRAEDPEDFPSIRRDVPGFGTFASFATEGYGFDAEFITAMDRFEAGLFDDAPQRPWAINLEAYVQPRFDWVLGTRYERSHELADAPKVQYGLVVAHSFCDYFAISAEWLHSRSPGDPDRELLVLAFLAQW